MVRITLYDPQVSASVYSQRRSVEQSGTSGIATGLARLGRALTERERGFRDAGSEVQALEEALGFFEEEHQLLDAARAKEPNGRPGFQERAVSAHLARREERIIRLKETDGEAAARFAERTRPLSKALARRAGAMEAAASGETLSGGLEGALRTAVRAVQADPLQHDDIRNGLMDTLSEMEASGVDADGLAGFRAAAERNLGLAAVGGLIGEGEFDAARELLAEGRLPGLAEEDRRALGRKVARAEARSASEADAGTAAGIDAYWAGFQTVREALREGREAAGVDYADETIRRVLPADQAEKMIALRDDAEDAGAAYGRVALASPEAIDRLIAGAGKREAGRLRAAARQRERRLAEDPAAFVLSNARVRAAHDAWQNAVEGADSDTIAASATAFAQASLDEQRRLGVPEAERRVLPAETAAAMAAGSTAAERPDPAALGAELRARFGDYWGPVLADLERAGLPEGLAAIAAMRRPDQQAAAQSLSALVGTPTAELRARINDSEAASVDQSLRALTPAPGLSDPASPKTGVETTLARRRAYELVAAGEDPATATARATAEIMTRSSAEAAAFKRSAPRRMAAAAKPPGDGRSASVIEAALPSAADTDRDLAMVDEIAALADRLGLDPEFLPPDSQRLLGVLRGLDQFDSLTPEQRRGLDGEIRRFQGRPAEFWLPLRDKYTERRRTARLEAERAAERLVDPDEATLVPLFEQYLAIDPADRADLQRLLFSRIPHSQIRPGGGAPENVAWLERALLGDDETQREFAAAYLEFTGSASYVEELGGARDEPLQTVLSPAALDAYLRFWHKPFERAFPLQEDFGSLWSQRTSEAAEILTQDWPVPDDIAISMVEGIQRSLYASEEGANALLSHIDRVVAPLNRELARGMRTAVQSLRGNRDSIEDIPGRYAFLLSDSDLLDLGEKLGLLTHNYSVDIDVPPDLMDHIGWLTPTGSLVAAGGVAEAAVAGTLVGTVGGALAAAGLVVAGADLYDAIDDHNQAHSDYLIMREIQSRLFDLRTFEDVLVDGNGEVGAEYPGNVGGQHAEGSEEIMVNEPFRALLNDRLNFHDPSTGQRVNPSGLLP